jgi:hypothetical protein
MLSGIRSEAIPIGSVIVGLPLKSNTAVKRKMFNSTFGSAPYSLIFVSVGIGTGIVGMSKRSMPSNNAARPPQNLSRS